MGYIAISNGGLITPHNVRQAHVNDTLGVTPDALINAVADTQIVIWDIELAIDDTDSALITYLSGTDEIFAFAKTGVISLTKRFYPFYLVCATNEAFNVVANANLGSSLHTITYQRIAPIDRS